MPAIGPTPHFDVEALLAVVHQQLIGVRVTTNNVAGFKRIVYEACRAQPSFAVHIYAVPGRPSALFLLKAPLAPLAPLPSPDPAALLESTPHGPE